uniref:DUF6589 domain-containing protein n=1 Tax=Knipowitschia caucasica TaxID=637954 RepID=A0AAV2M223_KNICA
MYPMKSMKQDLEFFFTHRTVPNILEDLSLSNTATCTATETTATTSTATSKDVDALDIFTFSGLSNEDLADLGVAPLSPTAYPTSPTPPTYSIIFDNLDFYMQTHHQSISHTNKSIHWINHMCVIDRVNSLQMNEHKPANTLSSYDIGQSLPGPDTQDSLRIEYIVLGSRILTHYLEAFKTLSSVVVHHIPHKFSEEMARPSTDYPLGLLLKDETQTADLVDVLQHFQREYVPRCPNGLHKILVGGDRLTEGNCRNAQLMFAEGVSEEERLEGLVFKFEDWHAIRNLFEIYHHIFFKEASAKDHSTLLANMNLLRSVTLR